jgi:hypothetical protein
MKLEIFGRIIQVGSEYGSPTVKIWLNHEPAKSDEADDEDDELPEYLECALSEDDAVEMAKNLYNEVRITIEAVARPKLVVEDEA